MDNQLSSVRALILDMDGVLWRGEQPIGDLPFIFSEIRRKIPFDESKRSQVS